MSVNVEASTRTAAQLFSTTVFLIPDFQREYSWGADDEVSDFWNDLVGSIDSPPYFLGLLIVTEEDERRVVVDGQQRITTLTLLANSIRRAALLRGRSLIADSMRDVFLYNLDCETEQRSPRILATAQRDKETLASLLDDDAPRPESPNPRLQQAQHELDMYLGADLERHDAGSRLARWARYISNGITFALFEHPDRNAAYKVYEVVNTRGRDLTPAELIKSYLIGSTPLAQQSDVYARWSRLEGALTELDAANQFTQFVRHVVTLRIGYVIPRDLYQRITETYVGAEGVERLLDELERNYPIYSLLIDPSLDDQTQPDTTVAAFGILNALGLRTVRPTFLAVAQSDDSDRALRLLTELVVTRLTMGSFGTGSIERRFADAAQRISRGQGAVEVTEELRADLAPTRRNFLQRLEEASLPKGLVLVLRSSLLADSALPPLRGFVHQVRPRNAEAWDDFSPGDYRRLGGTLGNHILLTSERRPRNTNTFAGAIERLFTLRVEGELDDTPIERFGARDVETWNDELAVRAADIWFGAL